MPLSPRAAVTGLGMVSSVGHGVVASCASSRAGLRRVQPLDGPLIVDPDTGDLEQALGHTVEVVADGFWKQGRLVRLGAAALADLFADDPFDPRARTGLFLQLPGGFYQTEDERRVRAEAAPPTPRGAPEPRFSADIRADLYRAGLGDALCAAADVIIPPNARHLLFGEKPGFSGLLADALRSLQEGRYEQCIVGGIDTLVEEDTIGALNRLGLLKTIARPVGFMPGEGAAFIRLEREDAARRRRATPVATIEAPSAYAEPHHRLSEEPALGVALAQAIAGTAMQLDDGGSRTGLVIGTLNGDPYRAYDWGTAMVRLRQKHPWIEAPQWYPALSFGEMGAASGPVAVCMAARGFARRYAGTSDVLVWLCGDDGGRSTFYLRRAAA